MMKDTSFFTGMIFFTEWWIHRGSFSYMIMQRRERHQFSMCFINLERNLFLIIWSQEKQINHFSPFPGSFFLVELSDGSSYIILFISSYKEGKMHFFSLTYLLPLDLFFKWNCMSFSNSATLCTVLYVNSQAFQAPCIGT